MADKVEQEARGNNAAYPLAFRLRDLPLELREHIYGLTIEPRAIFLATTTGHGGKIPSDFALPNMVKWQENIHARQRKPRSITMPGVGVLVFKVSLFTSLMAVAKDVNTEVQTFISLHQKRYVEYYEEILRSAIYLDRIVSPSPAFLKIWATCRLVLEKRTIDTIHFLRIIPNALKETLPSIVITEGPFDAWYDPSGKSWNPPNESIHPAIVFVLEQFPNIKHPGYQSRSQSTQRSMV
ncbi:hypothetical protein P153DRAFT_89866 [Dothidotthia symphoricarpi CBS 119687]|uniref:Uncharacterized protein n=1 Tax=Dothidotthia symphoricarpi CBS 119687 TaxID=1392245 RepID=A0A6A6A420_9PLEO|nr:uncharacterized protein P153DRAFT_89866 [Dothidotthia symphoricarpi CBS 119687]KAF2126296.1 hypothetical protein P153DRAFT_89866 [Dothidotthia symphoricarpi CBS 119687]